MKRIQKILLSPAATLLAFVLAAVLLLFSSVGGARAALTYYSETYVSRVQLSDIGVTLLENGKSVSKSDTGGIGAEVRTGVLLENMLAKDEDLRLNMPYDERLTVKNSGAINQYVRVSLYRYWVDADGSKLPDLDPASIDLGLMNLGSDWLRDPNADTPERTVLYYNRLLPVGDETPPLSDKLTISGDVALAADVQAQPDGTTRTVYVYDGADFVLEARVDAVQENNAQAAALSAWGRAVSIDEETGILSLL